MHATDIDEIEFYRVLQESHARVLLIGRMAMILRGLPVATNDYDFWLHADDVEKLNAALASLEHYPNCSPSDARQRGRYVLENGEHLDVMIARAATTKLGETLRFEDAWLRREQIELAPGVAIAIPSLEDHIRTKQWGLRAKDIGDIQLLQTLATERKP